MIGAWLSRLLRAMLRRWRPREGWPGWSLGALAALWPAWALAHTGWIRGANGLVTFAFLAYVILHLFFSRPHRRLRVAAMFLLPYPLMLVSLARALPPAGMWLNGVVNTLVWVLSAGHRGAPLAAWGDLFDIFSLHVAEFNGELLYWVQGALAGHVRSGRTALAVLLAVGLYAHVLWLLWAALRREDGLLAGLGGVFVTAWNMYWAGSGLTWVVGMLAISTLLAVALHYGYLERRWVSRRVDFSDQLRWDFGMMAGGLALAVLLVSPLIPTLTSPRLYAGIWTRISRPWTHVEQEASRLFPDVNRAPRSPLGRATLPSLPRSHKLSGSPRLLQSEVFTVRPREGKPLPPAYWYGQAYDVYTSRGWEQSPWQTKHLAAGEAWQGPVGQARVHAWHTVELKTRTRDVYAAGLPVAVDRPAQALVYDDKELIGMRLSDPTRSYVALGAINVADEAMLRGAGTAYPLWVETRYLALPPTVPARVRELARRITRDAPTPYDKARALEHELRLYPYSLDVPLPPEDRDLVDWFLFDLRTGYCDYYASAFVVLARSVGLPARFVMGYAQGRWDATAGVYHVTGNDAHSWPEVYFPSYGWVPFEPTASRPVFTYRETYRPTPEGARVSWQQTLAEFRAWARSRWRSVRLWRLFLWVVRIAVGLFLLYLAWWAYWLWRVPGPARAYAQLVWLGPWLGVELQPGWTPTEYVRALDARLRELGRAPALRDRVRAWAWRALARYLVWRYGAHPIQDAG